MSSFRIFNIAASALTAQNARLNTVASNLANADNVAGSADAAYKARQPVFRAFALEGDAATPGVEVARIAESADPAQMRHQPGHPEADENGYVYAPNVDVVEEMANMISASRSYRSSLEVMNTARDLMMRTLNVGR